MSRSGCTLKLSMKTKRLMVRLILYLKKIPKLSAPKVELANNSISILKKAQYVVF